MLSRVGRNSGLVLQQWRAPCYWRQGRSTVDVRLLGPLRRAAMMGPPIWAPATAGRPRDARARGRPQSRPTVSPKGSGEAPPASAPKMIQLYSRACAVCSRATARASSRAVAAMSCSSRTTTSTPSDLSASRNAPARALALWRGAALADLADEPFAAAEIRRLEELRLRATELAIDADLAAGRHAELISELDAMVAGTRCTSVCTLSACSRCTARAARPTRWRPTATPARRSSSRSAWSQARSCGASTTRSSRRTLRSTYRQWPSASAEAPPPSAGRASRPTHRRGAPVVAGLLAFGVIRVLEPDGLPGIDEDAVGLIDPDSGRITAQYAVGHGPEAVVAGAGSVWVANRLDGTVSRIDRESGRSSPSTSGVTRRRWRSGPGRCGWRTARAAGRPDRTGDEQGRAAHRHRQRGPRRRRGLRRRLGRLGGGRHRRATRHEDRQGRPADPGPGAAVGDRRGSGRIWVASDATARVARLDPRSGTPLAGIRVGNGPSSISVGAGAVWVANRGDGTVSRIDPESEVAETVRVGRSRAPWRPPMTASGWPTRGRGPSCGSTPRPAARHGRSTSGTARRRWPWSTARSGRPRSRRLDAPRRHPPRHRHGRPGPPESFDPASLSPHLGLVYDGLVTYRRAGGSAGGTIVPDLARELPEPSPDGRTYRFRLRPDIRFSTERLSALPTSAPRSSAGPVVRPRGGRSRR